MYLRHLPLLGSTVAHIPSSTFVEPCSCLYRGMVPGRRVSRHSTCAASHWGQAWGGLVGTVCAAVPPRVRVHLFAPVFSPCVPKGSRGGPSSVARSLQTPSNDGALQLRMVPGTLSMVVLHRLRQSGFKKVDVLPGVPTDLALNTETRQ